MCRNIQKGKKQKQKHKWNPLVLFVVAESVRNEARLRWGDFSQK